MKYRIHIGPIDNNLSSKNFFFGTGFLGEEFSSKQELIDLLHKYAMYNGLDGKRYWHEEIKLSFSMSSTIESIKEEGNRQIETTGKVNLFTALSLAKKDKFHGITIFYRPTGWIDEKDRIFKFVLERNEELTPQYKKLSEILRDLGIEI